MTSGWPQNSQDARWPQPDADDARSGSRAGGRVATDSDRGNRSSAFFGNEHPSAPLPVTRESGGRSSASLWADHPSGPLPATREPQRRGRGRSKSRDGGAPGSDAQGDADYDWIRYLGEAGPAQEHSRRPAADPRATGRPASPAPRRAAPPPSAAPPSAAPRNAAPPNVAPRGTMPPGAWPVGAPPSGGVPTGSAPASAKPADGAPAKTGGLGSRVSGRLSRLAAGRDRSAADTQPGQFPADAPAGRQGLPSRHSSRAAGASTAAMPASPARTEPNRPRAGDGRARTDEHRTRTYDYPAVTDDYRTQARHTAAMPQQDPARPSSGPHAAGRDARQAPESSAPWPVAPRPAEAPLGKPGRAQRRAGRRGPDPVGGSATGAFERSAAAASTATAVVDAPPVRPAPAKPAPATKPGSKVAGRKPAPRKRRHPVLLGLLGGGVVGALAAGGILATGVLHKTASGPQHHIVTPGKLLSYTQNPSLAKSMGAETLKKEILAGGGGEASHVVYAAYEDAAGSGSKAAPRILLFVGGNLSGSAQGFIQSFTGSLPSSFVISAGSLGGEGACVPGTSGHPAECVWADGDTFGLVASPAMSASTLASEMRSIRPLVELSDK